VHVKEKIPPIETNKNIVIEMSFIKIDKTDKRLPSKKFASADVLSKNPLS
jgi:hypothetical protein